MGDVVTLDVPTTLDLPPEQVLSKAIEANLSAVMIIGVEQDGSRYYASSFSDMPEMLWLMEGLKLEMLTHCDDT